MTINQMQSDVNFAEIFAKRPQVIKPGLQRMERALAALAMRPDQLPPSVLVAGTNGKGSTAGFLFRLLEAAGVRVGIFTSPHMQYFRERYCITGYNVSDGDLLQELGDLKNELPVPLYGELSFFEVSTLMALRLFKRHAVEAMVLEVGLGGRWDATNIVDPSVSVITSIGLDHQQFLGDSLPGIAREKAGIMRRGRPCLWGGNIAANSHQDERALTEALEQMAAEKGALLTTLTRRLPTDVAGEHSAVHKVKGAANRAGAGHTLSLRYFDELPEYLQRNFLLASAAFEAFVQQELPTCFKGGEQNTATVQAAVLQRQHVQRRQLPSLRGRFELIEEQRLLVDVCHNPAGANALCQSFLRRWPGRRVPVLLSVFHDKDMAGIVRELSPLASQFICYQNFGERSWQREDFEALEEVFARTGKSATWWQTLPQAWQFLQRMRSPGCGRFGELGEQVVSNFESCSAEPANKELKEEFKLEYRERPNKDSLYEGSSRNGPKNDDFVDGDMDVDVEAVACGSVHAIGELLGELLSDQFLNMPV